MLYNAENKPKHMARKIKIIKLSSRSQIQKEHEFINGRALYIHTNIAELENYDVQSPFLN